MSNRFDQESTEAGPTAPADEVMAADPQHAVGTLLAGPLTWGLIGIGADAVFDTGRLFLALGIVLGFVTSFYVVYVRFGRE